MDGVSVTPLSIIPHPNGDILHALKKSEAGFKDFGEAYFSSVHKDLIKGWKKHTRMTINLIVPVGEIEFICFDGADYMSIKLSQENYCRLTVQPGIWVAFRGKSEGLNVLLNIADIEHDPQESENCDLKMIQYEW